MSRIRSVHPGFFTDEDLVSVSMAARLLFIGIGVEADDKGIFVWKPLTIKMKVFPADNIDVSSLLDELVQAGAIKRYEADDKSYGAIKNFRKYQRPKTPNDLYPASADILNYVGLGLPNSETKEVKQTPFPPKGEITPQMEEEGGRKEEDDKTSVLPSSPAAPAEDAPSKKFRSKSGSRWATIDCPVDVTPEVWRDFEQLRRSKDAPITETVMKAIRREAEKVGWTTEQAITETILRNWQGFKSEWVKGNGTGFNNGGSEPVTHNPMVEAIAAARAKRASGESELFESDAGGWA